MGYEFVRLRVFEWDKGLKEVGVNVLIRGVVWVKGFICDWDIIVYLMNYGKCDR